MPQLRLPQTATYWGGPVPDGYGGSTFSDPLTVRCRWEEKNEEFVDANGQEKLSRVIVYLEDDVEVGGYLTLGESTTEDPQSLDDALPIQRYSKIPDIRAANYLRKAWL